MIPSIPPSVKDAMLAVSGSLAASILAKVTVTTALGLVGAWLARRSRASVRHALLAAAFGVLLLLPIASLLAPPLRIALVAAEQKQIAPTVTTVVETIQPEQPIVAVTPVIPRSPRLSPSDLLLLGWIAGIAICLLPVATGLWQIRSLRRSALPWRNGQPLVDTLALDARIGRRVEVLLHESLAGPMTCGILHPAIVLPRDAETWQREDLERAIVHELEHVRRGDWVSLSLARAVSAVYWFHPLVWIAWRQLALDAERSCDDAVLGRSEATSYADQLVGLAKRLSLSHGSTAKSPVLAMANRADLSARVGAVLDSRQCRGRAGKVPVALACAAAAVLVLTISPLTVVAAPPALAIVLPRPAAPQLVAPSASVAVAAIKHAPVGPRVFQVPAQPAAPPTTPKFSSTTRLIILDLTASDSTGKTIEGLHPGDFAVTEDGMKQAIEVFEFQRLDASTQTGVNPPTTSYYILGYYSPNAKVDGAYRKIKVALTGDTPARLEFKAGYYADRFFGRSGGVVDLPTPPAPSAYVPSPGPIPGAPIPIYQPEAQYSEEARKAKWQGSVTLSMEVDATGSATNINVIRSLGLGLDEKAVQAVSQWKFKPGTIGGQPVPVLVQIEVIFRLL